VRRLILSEFVSLDGVVQDPGGSEGWERGGWVFDFADSEQAAYKLEEVLSCDALLLGRHTYEEFHRSWPQRTGKFADQMNSMRKHVVSTTLREAAWTNSTLVREDVAERVAALKARAGGDILLVGSARLARSLLPHGLIDEYRLLVFPVILGGGTRLFADAPTSTVLRLSDARSLASGTTILTYRPRAT
jgi:dihydrofolate reductase